MSRDIAVRAIVLHQSKLLCVRLKAYRHASANDFWCLPGGGVGEGEALVPALEREMLEETGIKAQVGQLLYVHQFTHGEKEILEFFFYVTNAQDFLNIDLPRSSHGQDEISEIAFVDPGTTHILPKFLSTESLVQKAAGSESPGIFSYPK